MNKRILSTLKISVLAIILSLGIGYAFAWTAPSATPPNGNVSAPINTGSSIQTKAVGGDICVEKVAGTKKCLSDVQFAAPPTVEFTVAPLVIQDKGTATLSWSAVSGADSCAIYDPYTYATTDASIIGGTKTVGPINSGQANSPTASKSYTYTLTCDGTGGSTVKNAILNVLAPYAVSFTDGNSGWVTITSGVTRVTFVASGGAGGNGWAYGGGAGAYNGGGGGAYASTASGPIIYVGGGGGSGVGVGGAGGTTASGNGAGKGGNPYFSGAIYGSDGTIGAGGKGGAGGTDTSIQTPGGDGGAGNNPGNNGTNSDYNGGFGGKSGYGAPGNANGGYGGAAGGGGGGYGGGGGGGGFENTSYLGSGGGGGSYANASLSAPSPSGRSIALSAIGNPTQIYLGSGAKGVGWGGACCGSPGVITMSW